MADILLDLVYFLQDIIIQFGPLGLILAMILQSLISPIPSELLLSIAGSAYIESFGLYEGFVIAFIASFIGSIIGGLICYYIGFYFQSWLEKRITLKELKTFSQFIENYGIWAIIITRLTPFIPFDAISYVAGFVKLKKRDFIIGTIVGLVPRISFYLLIGSEVVDLVEEDLTLGLIVFVVIIISLFGLMFIIERILAKMQDNTEKQEIQSFQSSGNNDRINDNNNSSEDKNL
ncbi:MAG: TVP38/TMEM64 family protein [Candidatus Kariarchaeaceae archaeon]